MKYIAALLLILPLSVYALQVENAMLISQIKVESTNEAYIRVVETVEKKLTLPCSWKVVFFDVSTESGKSFLSLLLASKMADKSVSIGYEIDGSNRCSLLSVMLD